MSNDDLAVIEVIKVAIPNSLRGDDTIMVKIPKILSVEELPFYGQVFSIRYKTMTFWNVEQSSGSGGHRSK
jgi:hypothetical protein